ncbi:hypothetical protein QTO34_002552 [Cnephaeus nilssonii]|uniref:SPATS2-like protein n=1 Tax=Cnephaeus nilssonii TaxID=3371016 RepID=A0AA40HSB4_CNENI|nr:hypothetical protein QTO34_002552 [Eptesicus nilssonii]
MSADRWAERLLQAGCGEEKRFKHQRLSNRFPANDNYRADQDGHADRKIHVEFSDKIYAVRSVVPNKSNNEIVLVLQQFDFNVDKAVQAFVDGSAIQVLKEWNMTGKKKNNKRKRSKSKQHQGNKDAKDKAEKPEAGPPPPPQAQSSHSGGCEKDGSSTDSASEKPALLPREKKLSTLAPPSPTPRALSEGNRPLHQKLSLDGNPKPIHGTPERSEGLQWSAEQPCNPSKPHAKTSPVNSNAPAAHPEIKPDELAKKRGPNIEKSVKDLQRCTVSLTRYRVMIKEEVDSSVKKIKAAFAELHNCIIDKEVSLMAEMDHVKEEAMEILTARQKKAEELKRLTDLASQMAEMQLAELRAEIKHFVSERKYDEELGKAARFSCDIEQLKAQIMLCGEITHPKNNYSSRAPCSSLLPLLTAHAAASGKQSNFARNPTSRPWSLGPGRNHCLRATGPSAASACGLKGPSFCSLLIMKPPVRRTHCPYRTRFNNRRESTGSGNGFAPKTKGNSRHEHRRPPHNGFRPKHKGGAKNPEAPLGTKAPEAPAHPDKPRRRQHAADSAETRPFRGGVPRVSQCNLCPTRIEVSTEAAVLSVPAVTLVA